MKRTVKSLAAVVVYLLLLCYLLKAQALLLLSPRHIGMFLLGCVILCIPWLDKKTGWKELRLLFKKNAIIAGYLETFVLMFVSMSQRKLMREDILGELALNLRPLFYGFVCYVVFKEEELSREDSSEENSPKEDAKPGYDLSGLTRQEKQVAALIKRGLTNREIGEELCISETTVKKHVSNIFEKLGISSRRELK